MLALSPANHNDYLRTDSCGNHKDLPHPKRDYQFQRVKEINDQVGYMKGDDREGIRALQGFRVASRYRHCDNRLIDCFKVQQTITMISGPTEKQDKTYIHCTQYFKLISKS